MSNAECVQLYTPSGEHLTAYRDELPWNIYPRPQLKRDSFLNLNGWWDFDVNSGVDAPNEYRRRIRVPFCPECVLSGIGEVPAPGSSLWYRREFSLPQGFLKDRIILHIGAADQIAYVFVNDNYIGKHVGGYESFSFDITEYVQDVNVLEIRVVDNLPNTTLPYGKQRHKRGGMWYTPVSGIWQTVWLESVPSVYVHNLSVQSVEEGVLIQADGVSDGVVTVKTPGGTILVPLQDGGAVVELPDPRWWSPDDPFLYEFTLESGADCVESYFAMRTLDIRHIDGVPRMCLNGKPIFFHAVLDQGYWSDGLFTPADPNDYAWDIQQMKALGFNTLRKHIKIEPQQFYYDCDRLGMLVWQDMVNNGSYSFLRDTALPTVGLKRLSDKYLHRDPLTQEAFIEGMVSTVSLLDRHPSIVGWTIFNEGWGQFNSDEMYWQLRQMDPSRFIDTASGWFKGAQSDVISEHVYFKPFRFVAGNKPVFLSEFGGYSFKPKDHVFNITQTYGYRLYDDQERFMDDLEKLYMNEIIPAVKSGLCGAVYTQLSDVEDETNGLISYDRKVCKVDQQRMLNIAKLLLKQVEEVE